MSYFNIKVQVEIIKSLAFGKRLRRILYSAKTRYHPNLKIPSSHTIQTKLYILRSWAKCGILNPGYVARGQCATKGDTGICGICGTAHSVFRARACSWRYLCGSIPPQLKVVLNRNCRKLVTADSLPRFIVVSYFRKQIGRAH